MRKEEFMLLTAILVCKEQDVDQRMACVCKEQNDTKVLLELEEKNWITHDLTITDDGIQALEPYRAKRLILLAAGLGSRMLPITINTPKPLVRVHGKCIIESAIEAAHAAGIEDIYIVRGYLAEVFEQLRCKYPEIHFVDNPEFSVSNNISSALRVKNMLSNAYIMEADLFIRNSAVIRKYNYSSNCLGVPVEKTDDWCILNEDGRAKLAHGGTNCHHLFSIYYWTAEDGARLPEHLVEMYQRADGKDRFWDMAPMDLYNHMYHVEVVECSFNDITEIDTFKELQSIDQAYMIS